MKVATLMLHYWPERRIKYGIGLYKQWGTVLVLSRDFKITPEHDVRNEGVAMLSGFDVVFTVDDDEFITPEDQALIVERFEKDRNCEVVMCGIIDYAAGLRTAYKPRGHMPVVAVKPGKGKFYDLRCIQCDKLVRMPDIKIHHTGYAIDRAGMKAKIERYEGLKRPDEIKAVNSIISGETFPASFPFKKRGVINDDFRRP